MGILVVNGCAHIGGQNVRVICAVKKLLELVGVVNAIVKLTTIIYGCVLTIHGLCKDGHVFCWSLSEELYSQTGGKAMFDNLCLDVALV